MLSVAFSPSPDFTAPSSTLGRDMVRHSAAAASIRRPAAVAIGMARALGTPQDHQKHSGAAEGEAWQGVRSAKTRMRRSVARSGRQLRRGLPSVAVRVAAHRGCVASWPHRRWWVRPRVIPRVGVRHVSRDRKERRGSRDSFPPRATSSPCQDGSCGSSSSAVLVPGTGPPASKRPCRLLFGQQRAVASACNRLGLPVTGREFAGALSSPTVLPGPLGRSIRLARGIISRSCPGIRSLNTSRSGRRGAWLVRLGGRA